MGCSVQYACRREASADTCGPRTLLFTAGGGRGMGRGFGVDSRSDDVDPGVSDEDLI